MGSMKTVSKNLFLLLSRSVSSTARKMRRKFSGTKSSMKRKVFAMLWAKISFEKRFL